MANKNIYKLTSERITSDSIVHEDNNNYVNLKTYLEARKKETQQNYYQINDTFTNAEAIILYGYVTSGTTAVRLSFPVPKKLDNITSIIVQSFKGELRGGKGYLNNQSGDVEYVNKSGYTLNLYKSNGCNIYVTLDKNSAFTNVDNNTPVMFTIYPRNLKLKFS